MTESKEKRSLHAVLYQQGGQWAGVCLEHYILALGSSLPELVEQLRKAITASLAISAERGGAPFEGIPRSPQRFWDLYSEARPLSGADASAPEGDPAAPPIELRTAALGLAA